MRASTLTLDTDLPQGRRTAAADRVSGHSRNTPRSKSRMHVVHRRLGRSQGRTDPGPQNSNRKTSAVTQRVLSDKNGVELKISDTEPAGGSSDADTDFSGLLGRRREGTVGACKSSGASRAHAEQVETS